MRPLRMVLLLCLYLILSEDHCACCLDSVLQISRPSISHLQAISDKQSLVVSWQLNHSSLEGNIYEIQIGRTENHTIIYSTNVSAPSMDSHEWSWTWTSDLPLECVDHSVKMRIFYSLQQSVPSPWSNWKTNYGARAKNRSQIFPFQQVLREGTTAMFCCIPAKGVNITSMSINNITHPLISIDDRVKAIRENLKIPKEYFDVLSIKCSDDSGNHRHIWNYLSSPPQKPINFSCVTPDMKVVTCSWDSDREPELENHNKKTYTLHIQNSGLDPILCEQLSCTFRAVVEREVYNITVVVKDRLGEVTESYSFNVSDRVSPVAVWHNMSPGVTNSSVSWLIPGNLSHLNLLCQVSTVPDSTAEMRCKSINGFCKVRLEHLQPNTRYSARVRCSADGRFWGKWSQPVAFKTYPSVTLDLWRRIKQLPNSRQVTLAWTASVPDSAESVNMKGYKVQWSQGGRNFTELKDSGQTQVEVSIGAARCDFSVQALVHSGFTVSTHTTVPQRDDREKPPSQKQLSSSATGFNLAWEKDKTATCGYTVDWCTLGNAVPCTLQWVRLSERNNTLFLPGRYFKEGRRYMFNIYGCRENGHRLQEIQIGYLKELKSALPPSLVRLVQSTSSSVTLDWHYSEDDASQPAFITGYFITVQEVRPDKPLGHASDLFNVSVADPHKKSVTVEDLQQNKEYIFCVSTLTKEGPGQAASITVRTKVNYTTHVIKILTPILVMLGLIILLWPKRKILLRGMKGVIFYPAGMNIKTLELDSFLKEIAEYLQTQKPEECRSCDIEILNTKPLLWEPTEQRDPDNLYTAPPSGLPSSSLTPAACQVDYFPQLWHKTALRQTSISNKSYFHTPVGDQSDSQTPRSDIRLSLNRSEGSQELCNIVYDYISS